jgi:hypothetical protein
MIDAATLVHLGSDPGKATNWLLLPFTPHWSWTAALCKQGSCNPSSTGMEAL